MAQQLFGLEVGSVSAASHEYNRGGAKMNARHSGEKGWGSTIMGDVMRRGFASQDIQHLYAAALEGNLLDALLDCVVKYLGGTPVTIFGVDTANHANNFLLHRGLLQDAVVLHMNKLTVGNPWLEAQWKQPVGLVYQDTDLINPADFQSWPRYKEWCGMLGGNKHATGVVLDRRGNKQLVLELHFTAAQQERYRRPATELFNQLAPHLLLGEQIMRLRREFPIHTRMATSLLELSSLPVVIIDTGNQIHNMNRRAQMLASQMDTFFISAGQEFHAMDLASEASFQSTLHGLVNSSRRVSEVITLWNGARSKRVFVAMAKLGQAAPQQAFPVRRFEAGEELIALIIQDVDEPLDIANDTLWKAFRLSNAECELAVRLLHGDTVGDVAVERGMSKQTLRNQLSSIMKKTSTSRQAQLISLLTRLAVGPLS
jgi:DNA-binding CsgD family transcriptional regulator